MKTNPLRISPACDTIMSKFAIIFLTNTKDFCRKESPMKKHKSITILLMCMLLLVSVCAGILFGSVNIAFKDILNCLTGADRSSTSYILITTVRIPRLLGGLFAGIGLSCSGVILQGVMNNSLASPSTIGVNSGSGFAVMLAMIFFPANSFTLPVFAFCGALITTLLIFFLAAL